MAQPIWNTDYGPGGRLAVIDDETYYEFQLNATNTTSYLIIGGVLPPGLILNVRTGLISGVIRVIDAFEANTAQFDYTFTVRAKSPTTEFTDRTFILRINYVRPIWVTSHEHLGTVKNGTSYEYKLETVDPNNVPINHNIIAGALPPGLTLDQTTGVISGVLSSPDNTIDYKHTFTVKAENTDGNKADKTFVIEELTIGPPQIMVVPPPIIPNYLGQPLVGTTPAFSFELVGITTGHTAPYTWSIKSGALPPSITLTTDGLLVGYYYPEVGPNVMSYTFEVEVFDGINRDTQTYTIDIMKKVLATADNDIITADNNILRVDNTSSDPYYIPIITTQNNPPVTRHQTEFLFDIDAIDLNGDAIIFKEVISLLDLNTPVISNIPPELTLNPNTGIISGHIAAQIADSMDYHFFIMTEKALLPAYKSIPVEYVLTIIGSQDNRITWISPEYLGEIFNGDISEFNIAATSPSGAAITYTLLSGALPMGTLLQSNGLIVGRIEFNDVVQDSTITYTFTINAEDTAHSIISTKTFTLTVNNRYIKPYENVYMAALLRDGERATLNDIFSNTNYFPVDAIYRPTDPYFGKATDIKFLFLPGLNPTQLNNYLIAINTNHYAKRIELGNIRTAIAHDANFNIKYEVVYLEVIDNLVNNGRTVTQNNKTITSTNPYSAVNTNTYRNMKPNSFYLMQQQLRNIGFYNEGALPDWMTSRQENGQVLGLINAVVLAYTYPGASKLIAYRLNFDKVLFDELTFIAERYYIDNSLSTNYDIPTNQFLSIPIEEPIVQNITHEYVRFPSTNIFK